MRRDTKVWAKFESIGKPKETRVINGSMYEIVMSFADWIQDVYMGSCIKMTIARTEHEMERNSAKWIRSDSQDGEADNSMMHDLMELMGQKSLGIEDQQTQESK